MRRRDPLTLLSGDPDKRAGLAGDTYFQDAVEQLAALTSDMPAFCQRHALLLLKPDAVVARQLTPAVDWLARNGFQIVAAERIRLDRHVIRAVWQSQWRNASSERRWLADLLATAADSLVLLVRVDTGHGVSAPVLLTSLKGASDPDGREPGQLRHLLGHHSYLLNMAHTADEPADMLRELAIYFDVHDLRRVLRDALAGQDRSARAKELVRGLYFDYAWRYLDVAEHGAALLHEVDSLLAQGGMDSIARLELSRAIGPAEADLPGALAALLHWSRRHDVALDPWSVIVVGASVLPMVRDDRQRRLLADEKRGGA